MQRKTIGRNHVKADPRKQHDAASFRPCVPPLKRLEDGDLAGDVEVVDAGAQAGFDERLGGILKGPAQFNTTATSFSARSIPAGSSNPKTRCRRPISPAIPSSLAPFRPAIIAVVPERVASRATCSPT
jgi:hypothetical protein